jgi:hypothetical protein
MQVRGQKITIYAVRIGSIYTPLISEVFILDLRNLYLRRTQITVKLFV